MFVRLVVYKITKKPVWYKKNPTEIAFGFRVVALCLLVIPHNGAEEEEDQEEEEDKLTSSSSSFSFLEVIRFNDTIEGPRAPAVKPGHVTQA